MYPVELCVPAFWLFYSSKYVKLRCAARHLRSLGAGIGRNVIVWRCRRRSVPRELVYTYISTYRFFQVGGVLFVAFVSEAFFGVKNASS